MKGASFFSRAVQSHPQHPLSYATVIINALPNAKAISLKADKRLRLAPAELGTQYISKKKRKNKNINSTFSKIVPCTR